MCLAIVWWVLSFRYFQHQDVLSNGSSKNKVVLHRPFRIATPQVYTAGGDTVSVSTRYSINWKTSSITKPLNVLSLGNNGRRVNHDGEVVGAIKLSTWGALPCNHYLLHRVFILLQVSKVRDGYTLVSNILKFTCDRYRFHRHGVHRS